MIKHRNITFLLCLIGLSITNIANSQHFGLADQNRFSVLIENIELNHVQYAALADSIDERFRKTLVNRIDPTGRFFLRSDESQINELLTTFTSQNWEESAMIMDSCYVHLRDRIFTTIRFLEALETCNFTENDSIILVPNSHSLIYAQDEAEFESRWKRNIKYNTLLSTLGDSLTPEAILMEKWKQEVDNSTCELKTIIMENGKLKEMVFNAFLNTYAQAFDPHTEYFSLEENEIFNSSLSSQIFTPGFFIQPSGSGYYISELSPKISVSFSELHVGDEIVGIEKNQTSINPACLSEGDMYNYFYGHADSIISVKIKCPKDHITRAYKFTKSVTENAFNTSLGYYLTSSKVKVGYLALPSFYAIQDGAGTSAGNDLATLIMQMKASNSDAIILDLRGNGGGSIQEAINLAGLFIDYGPLFLTRSNLSEIPTLIKDTKKGRLYDGKLVIMVNEYSASASELIANTLQTYPNTLIVGTTTYGKSSGQDMVPLYDNYELFGYAKITSLEIFRFDGETLQQKGVSPDIYIPSGLPSVFLNEAHSNYSLSFPKSSKKINPILIRNEPIEFLKRESEKRIVSNHALNYMKQLQETMNKLFSSEMVLKLQYNEFKWPLENIKDVSDTSAMYSVEAINSEVLLDSASNVYNNLLIKEDPVLNETMHIINDWILTTTND
ncbi:S41 family peptidase [Marinoscillum pacificum]|uniref:S41 family peptidase n=1 Tax=Marinoscillum pacificum TaxID=392723 RepID=UPI002157547C|nr:S41 family peptidase [Marinoscillum pacificum]